MISKTHLETLISYVPRFIINQLMNTATPSITESTYNFPAVVLFADISGFTALTEQLAQQGPVGAEILTRELNSYFGQLINLITSHKGDVAKFAGDALTAIWPLYNKDKNNTNNQTLAQIAQQATACALAIQATLQNYKTDDGIKLTLRIGIGVGKITIIQLGGVYSRWEFAIMGDPMTQVSQAQAQAQPGQVILSPQVWELVKANSSGQQLPTKCVQLKSLATKITPSKISPQIVPPNIENALRAFIPGAILARLAAGQSGWLAELRRVTILFVSLPNLTEHTPLKQAQTVMQALQTALYRYEGSVNKISVDEKGATLVVALGLTPFAHEDDATRGIQVALAMQAALKKLNWKCAIGITTGRAFCGSVGNETRREYIMMGDVVNLSARLMQAATKNTKNTNILCDHTTYQSARTFFKFTTLTPIMVKGKAEAISIYNPIRKWAGVQTSMSTRKSKIEMVGRHTERLILTDKLQDLLHGHNSVVIIEGEAGIGKSELAANLLSLAKKLGVKNMIGAGNSIEKTNTYHAWEPVFRKIFSVTELGDTKTMHQKVQEKLALLVPELADWYPLLDVALPLDFPDNAITKAMQGKLRAENTRTLLTKVLLSILQQKPLMLIMEDAHWLDSASWALLDHVKQAIKLLFLVVVTRPMATSGARSVTLPSEYKQLLTDPNTQHIELNFLSPDDALMLVCKRLGVSSLPKSVATLIRTKAEGHPFFSEELAYALRDAGLIQIVAGECHLAPGAGDLSQLNFPDTIQGVITSRIDRLNPQQQLTLKVASVIGRIFDFNLLRDVYPIKADKPYLADYLKTLQSLDITPIENPEPGLAYIFKHIIIEEVAYNLMAFAQRRQLHQSIAEWYEKTYSNELSPFYPLLAYHWSKVVEGQQTETIQILKAVDYLQKSGQQAVHNYANQEAVGFFDKALALLKTLPTTTENTEQELRLQIAMGNALMSTKGYAAFEVEQAYTKAWDLCQQLGDTPLFFPVLYGLWVFYLVRGEHLTSQEYSQKFLAMAQAQQNPAPLMMAHRAMGASLLCLGQVAPANTHLKQMVNFYNPNDHQALAFVYGQEPGMAGLSYLALSLWLLGYPEQAHQTSEKALSLIEDLTHPHSWGFAMCFAAFLNQLRYDWHTVEQQTQLAISLSNKNGFALWKAVGTIVNGWAVAEGGQTDKGISIIKEGLSFFYATGSAMYHPYWLGLLADIYKKTNKAKQGLLVLNEALVEVNKNEERWYEAELYRLKGELLHQIEEANGQISYETITSSPEECFLKAISIAKTQEAKSLELRATIKLSRLWLKQGKKQIAYQQLSKIYNWFTEGFNTPDLKEAKELLETIDNG